jgi:4-amino-4-deoxy-L-arabinose transferase-like glycosyltransferase
VFNRQVGLWAGVFAACSPIHIYYSQEARGYSLLLLLLVLGYILLWRALRLRTLMSWTLAVIASTLALYTHYLAIVGLLPSVLLVWSFPDQHRSQNWGRYSLAVLSCALLASPWYLWVFVFHAHASPGLDWIRAFWEHMPPSLAIPRTLEVLGLGSQSGRDPAFFKVYPFVTIQPALRILGLVTLFLLALWIAGPWMDHVLGIREVGKRKTWLWSMLAFPLAMLWLISQVRPVYLVGRYDLLAFPAYCLLVGLAIAKLQLIRSAGPFLAAVALVGLALPLAAKLDRYYEASTLLPKDTISASETAVALATMVSNGDVVVYTGVRGLPVLYYLHRLGFDWQDGVCRQRTGSQHFGCRMYPLDMEMHPAIYAAPKDEHALASVQEGIQTLLRGLEDSTSGLWVVAGGGTFNSKNMSLPDLDYQLVNGLVNIGFRVSSANFYPSRGIFEMKR